MKKQISLTSMKKQIIFRAIGEVLVSFYYRIRFRFCALAQQNSFRDF